MLCRKKQHVLSRTFPYTHLHAPYTQPSQRCIFKFYEVKVAIHALTRTYTQGALHALTRAPSLSKTLKFTPGLTNAPGHTRPKSSKDHGCEQLGAHPRSSCRPSPIYLEAAPLTCKHASLGWVAGPRSSAHRSLLKK